MNEQTKARIKELQKEKDVVILAHYYVDGEVQEIADYVGDSYYLAKVATTVEQQNILVCGVSFMGESAKLLNAKKHVYMADDERIARWHIWRKWRRSRKCGRNIRMWQLSAM